MTQMIHEMMMKLRPLVVRGSRGLLVGFWRASADGIVAQRAQPKPISKEW